MALRYAEEPERRLTPEEARAFLQVHSEREAAGSAPLLDDLAETLGLTPEEAQSILAETRLRSLAAESPLRARRPLRGLVWVASALAVVLAAQIAAANLLPEAGAEASSSGLSESMPRAARGTPLVDRLSMRIDGYEGDRLLPESVALASQASAGDATIPTLGAGDAALRLAVVRKIQEHLGGRVAAWRRADRLSITLALPGHLGTRLDVPLGDGDLRQDGADDRVIARALDVAWPQILAAPRP